MRHNSPRRAVGLILASGSPRRAALLKAIGIPFRVVRIPYRERTPRRQPAAAARFVAARKAVAAEEHLRRFSRRGLLVTGDTIVACGGLILGKPGSRTGAVRQLRILSGATHRVVTAIAIVDLQTGRRLLKSQTSRVTMRRLGREEIERYVATGEPMDKAGSYAVQGKGRRLVARVKGDYFNVVGFPVRLFARMIRGFGVAVPRTRIDRLYRRIPPEPPAPSARRK